MRFLLRRAVFYLVTIWGAVTLNFLLPRLIPGDPVSSLLSKFQGRMSAESVQAMRVLFGLDEDMSLWQQYLAYWHDLLTGNMGLSFSKFPAPVSQIIANSLPWTIGLVGIATVIAFFLGTAVGAAIGWRRGTWADGAIPVTTLFTSIPYFWIGIVAVAVFGLTLQWFPTSGGYDRGMAPEWSWAFVGSLIYHGALPALTIVVSSVGKWILDMRNMMVTVSTEDYVTVAHAKGLRESWVLLGYAARNAILPQISGFALSLGFVVSGTLIMEMVFSYPGIGFNLFQAVGANDYPLMQGIFLVITVSVLVANMLADFIYVLFDPRTRQES